MIIDGKKLAGEISAELKKEFEKLPRLTIGAVLVGKNPASMSFLKQKSKAAGITGVNFKIFTFNPRIKTERLQKEILKLNNSKNIDGIIIQLPLPEHIDAGKILGAISSSKDIDALSSAPRVLAPTVKAVKFIFEKYKINYKNKAILIIGRGHLVGRPIYKWLAKKNKRVKNIDPVREKSLQDPLEVGRGLTRPRLLTGQAAEAAHLRWTAFSNGVDERQRNSLQKFTRSADIIISGAGKGGLVKGAMIKKGSVLIDFGFDRQDGKIKGDFDFESCAKKAKLITPVPGGMGPITVAMLFKNLVTLVRQVEK